MPPHIKMVFLSATVPNDLEIAQWISRTKEIDVYVERHTQRPVPLAHSVFSNDDFYKICDPVKGFNEKEYNRCKKSFKKSKFLDNRFWITFVEKLKKKDLTPALIFSFSQMKCMEIAKGIRRLKEPLINKNQQNYVRNFISKSLQRLDKDDRNLPQIRDLTELLCIGVGVHHGGILPIFKEITEILLTEGYVKVLFCTSTFAMGINAPVRTCAFTSLKKFNGKELCDLTATEYIQMSGRAGRRGLDSEGTSIIILCDVFPTKEYLKEIYLGKAEKLESQFQIRVSMILSFIRAQGIDMIDILKQSLSSNNIQNQIPIYKNELLRATTEFENEKRNNVTCIKDIEDTDISPSEMYVSNYSRLKEINENLISSVSLDSVLHKLAPGMVILVLYSQKLFPCIISRFRKDRISVVNNMNQFCEIKAINIIGIYKTSDVSFKKPDQNKIKSMTNQLNKIAKSNELLYLADELNLVYEYQSETQTLKDLTNELLKSPCLECDEFKSHINHFQTIHDLQNRIEYLEKCINGDQLNLLPILENYLRMLSNMNYITQDRVISFKGRIDLELPNQVDLISTELLFQNFFNDLSPQQIVCCLSCLFAQRIGISKKNNNDDDDKNQDTDDLKFYVPPDLIDLVKEMIETSNNIANKYREFGILFDEDKYFEENINYRAVYPIYAWAQRKSFVEVMEEVKTHNIQRCSEGIIIRLILDIKESLNKFSNAAKLMGDLELSKRFNESLELISRGIIFTESIYLS